MELIGSPDCSLSQAPWSLHDLNEPYRPGTERSFFQRLFPQFKATLNPAMQQASSRLKAFRSACSRVWMVKSCQIDLTHEALLLATCHLRQLQLAWVRESSKSHRLQKMRAEIVPTFHLCIFMPLLRFHTCKNERVTFGSYTRPTRPAGTVWAAAPDTDLTSTGYQSHWAMKYFKK